MRNPTKPKLLVLQIEDRSYPPDHIISIFLAKNRLESQRHHFEYVFENSGDPDLPPWWWKTFRMLELMKERPDVDIIMWMDSDAFFWNFRRNNPLTYAKKDVDTTMWVAPDYPPQTSPFCAGAFFVRNDARGRELFEAWVRLYDRTRWSRSSDGRWACKGEWAGRDYEQGSLAQIIMPDPAYSIKSLPPQIMNNIDCVNTHPDCMVVHLFGDHKERLKDVCMPKAGARLPGIQSTLLRNSAGNITLNLITSLMLILAAAIVVVVMSKRH
jgi:hypothetical protein